MPFGVPQSNQLRANNQKSLLWSFLVSEVENRTNPRQSEVCKTR